MTQPVEAVDLAELRGTTFKVGQLCFEGARLADAIQTAEEEGNSEVREGLRFLRTLATSLLALQKEGSRGNYALTKLLQLVSGKRNGRMSVEEMTHTIDALMTFAKPVKRRKT